MDSKILSEIKKRFYYDYQSGKLKCKNTGACVGWKNGNGYLRVGVLRAKPYVHQIVWFLHSGSWPDAEIDHINCDPLDNRVINLRECSSAENKRNTRKRSHSRQPYKGVRKTRKGDNWEMRIRADGKTISRGGFSTPEDAYAAYLSASAEHHGEFGRTA